MVQTNPVPRYFLSFLIALLPLFTALSEQSFSPDKGTLGMGASAPVSLEPSSTRAVLPSNQTKTDIGSFEVAQLSLSAAQWRLVGRFVSTMAFSDQGLLLFGKLQLEGG